MMLDARDLRSWGQQRPEVTAPAGRVLALAVALHLCPIEDFLDAPAQARSGLGLHRPDWLQHPHDSALEAWRFRAPDFSVWVFIVVKRYGKWKDDPQALHRWQRAGVWEKVFASLGAALDDQYLVLDLTPARVHQRGAAGKGGP
jgi:hypothetical protein